MFGLGIILHADTLRALFQFEVILYYLKLHITVRSLQLVWVYYTLVSYKVKESQLACM